MARTKKPAATDERAPVQAVENPILNGPYDEPALHWSYRLDGQPVQLPWRREAGYWAEGKDAITGQLSLGNIEEDAVQPFDKLHLVNALRADVRRWRKSDYRGATATTRELFSHWFRTERTRRLFFCQREAIETLVYILELALPGQLGRTRYKTFEVGPDTFTKLFAGQPAGYPNDDQTREAFYAEVRPQQVEYELARRITEALVQGATGPNAVKFKENVLARHQIFPAILRIVRRYVAERVDFMEGVDPRELALEVYARPLIERLLDAIQPAAGTKEHPFLPVVPHYKPWLDTDDVNYLTRRPVHFLKKSHLNAAPLDSDGRGGSVGERAVIDKLEELPEVEAFTPNDKNIGLAVPYALDGVAHSYVPDFIVKLTDGTFVVLEVKGGGGLIHEPNKTTAKSQAAKKWVAALNNAKFAGRWDWVLCDETTKLAGQLRAAMISPPKAAPGAKVLELVKPTPETRWKTCVPKVSLQAAANAFSDEQLGLELPEHAVEWLTWEGMPRLEKDMFVARVVGKCMEPDIEDGAWCLFRPIPIEQAGDRPVLVRHAGHFDEDTGGQYGVKRLKVEYGEVDGQRVRTAVVLQPKNPSYPALVIKHTDDIEVQVIGEVVVVLGVAHPV